MKITARFFVVVGILMLAAFQSLGQTPQSDELVIGPVVASENIQGVPVNIPITVFLKLATSVEGVTVNIRVVANLGDLQQKVGSVIDTLPLPHDVCGHFGNNTVARIWGKELNASDDILILRLHGDVNEWTCVKNPIPCSKVDWSKIYPQVTLYDCNSPIETQVINQPFTAALSVKIAVVDGQALAVNILKPEINLGGQYGGISQGILNIAGADINQKAADAIKQAVDPNKLRQALPPEIQTLNLKIADSGFSALNGQALVTLHLSGTVPASQLSSLIQAALAPKPGAKP
jgi:hypothetical protein